MPNFKTYLIGFILSLVLTFCAYFLVVSMYPNTEIIILFLAVLQVMVQLIFFLHLMQTKDGGWSFLVLNATLGVILILVLGSLWIMNHLNYNMMPESMNHDIMKSENIRLQIRR